MTIFSKGKLPTFVVGLAAIAALFCFLQNCASNSHEERPNILFVIVDDLRPELGCYDNTEISTPQFDTFAEDAMVFKRAYCQNAACAPSRASVMLGMRPASTGVLNLSGKFRQINPDAVTLPQHFHKFGYYTVALGKTFHNHMHDPVSFDEPDLRPAEYRTPEMIDRDPESFYYDDELNEELAQVRAERLKKNPKAYAGGWAYGRSTENSDAPDNAFYDGAQTDLALETLERLKTQDQPFFMALGYYRPHLPFVAPKKYWDLYDRDKLSLASNPYLPEDSPPMAMNSSYELTACYDLEYVKHPAIAQLSEDTVRLLKHGYYASVSYVDACFGKLIQGLKDMGLDNNTIVVVWGDHGWKLGEHGSWCKQTNYNIDTRVPLFIYDPRNPSSSHDSESLVELVDLFPTLCDLAEIEIPDYMEGMSLKPLLENPEQELKSAAFSHYHQRPKNTLDGKHYMGYSMVTTKYHYVEWYSWDDEGKVPGDLVARELYNNQLDPEENVNISELSENAEIVQALSEKLKAGWQAARIDK